MREPQSKAIENCSPGYRVYCTNKENEVMLLLIAGDKSRQEILNQGEPQGMGLQFQQSITPMQEASGHSAQCFALWTGKQLGERSIHYPNASFGFAET